MASQIGTSFLSLHVRRRRVLHSCVNHDDTLCVCAWLGARLDVLDVLVGRTRCKNERSIESKQHEVIVGVDSRTQTVTEASRSSSTKSSSPKPFALYDERLKHRAKAQRAGRVRTRPRSCVAGVLL